MDDYIIIHEDKEYLKNCLKIIEEKLNKEYKLRLNKNKTKIIKSDVGVNFLGYTFKVKNKKTIIKINSSTKRNIKIGLKKVKNLYNNGKITFLQLFSSYETYKNSYKYIDKKVIKDLIDNNWY